MYENTTQMAKLCKKEYEFKLPEFGKSTTDPTYYEPQATRIANMRKSATAGKSLYDFTEEEYNKMDISDVHIVPGRKPGLTQEEISQNYQDIKSELNNNLEENKTIIEQDKKDIEKIKKTIETISSNDSEQ